MKKILLYITLICLFTQISYSEQREYFGVYIHDPSTNVPVALGRVYYDEVVKEKPIYDMSFDEWFNAPHATSNWLGFRTFLEDNGIVPVINYVGDFASNVSGGKSQGSAISSSVNLGLGIDLEKLTGSDAFEGWSIGNTWVWRFGDNATNKYINNAFNVQQNYGSQTIQLQSLYLTYVRNLDEDLKMTLKFGRFAAADNFMSKPIYWIYQNNAFDGTPVGVFKQTEFSAYPASTWGAFVHLTYNDAQYVKAGVYQINTDAQDDSQGLDFSFEGAGVNANIEVGWDINHNDSGKSPGNISAGFVADWYNAPHNDDASQYDYFNCSIYIQADYMIYNLGFVKEEQPYYIPRKEDKWRDLRGIILWGVIQYDPYENLAQMPLFINGGILFNAPFKSRADDVLALGVAYGKYSNTLLDTYQCASYEMVVELNYKFQVNRFAFVQPNLQYVINTNGGQYPNAFVIGLQFGLNL